MGIIDRIKEYIEYKGISKYRFYKETGFSNGFLDKNSSIGSDKCEQIIYQYPDIDPEWLLTGRGGMLRTTNQKQNIAQESCKQTDAVIFLLKEQLQEAQNEIANLNREIGMLQNKNSQLQIQVKDFGQEIITEPPGSSPSSILPLTDVDSAAAHL